MRRRWAGLLAVTVGVVGGLGVATSTTASAETPIVVTDATFSWSLNDQTNARSHNPAAINFLSAGVADPGRGGASVTQAQWSAASGAVSVQKRDAAGAWQSATWTGLGTDAHGTAIGITGPFSGHRVLLSAGTGTLDPVADSASLSWAGTFSVVYYGGNSIFTVTDPSLEVAAGAGSVTAVLGGWESGRDDPTAWSPLPPERVQVAALSGVDITESGAVATPAYRGVEVAGTTDQTRTGADWGSFPAPMIGYLAKLGIDQFWYSTGLSSDPTKVPQPISIGYAGGTPAESTPTTAAATPTTAPSNPVRQPPPVEPAKPPAPPPSPAPSSTEVAQPVEVLPTAAVTPALPARTPAGATGGPHSGPAISPVQVTAEPAATPAATATVTGWWAGGVLLLAAGLLLIVPARRTRNVPSDRPPA